MYAMIYDAVMKLLVEHRINVDGLEPEIEKMQAMFGAYYPDEQLDKEALLRQVLFDYGVFEGVAKILEDNRDHIEWLADERSSIKWNFWSRYKKYLEVDEKLPPTVVASIDETTEEITEIMSKWSIQLLDINGPTWVVYDYDMDIKYIIRFLINFDDLETRIKLEDLKLNVIHHIESLRDETTYRDNLVNSVFLD